MWKTTFRLLLPILLLLPLSSCGKKTNTALLGTWETKANNKTCSLTFEKDGNLQFGGDTQALSNVFTSLTLITDFGGHPGKNTPVTYTCISDNQMEIEGDFTVLLDKLSAGGGGGPVSEEWKKKIHPRETLTFAVSGNELTLTNEKGTSTTFKRVE
jgi:hypothetical protein